MTTIVTRAGKGSPLTNLECDTNFTNLNTFKIETALLAAALGVATLDASARLLTAQLPLNIAAATVTTNANLTGPITSIGNATSIASQTGTGTTFAMSVSPAFTGAPAAPTAAADTNSTQLATTAFVVAQASATNPLMSGAVAIGLSLRYARADHVHPSDLSRAPTASPTFTGSAQFNIISATGQIQSQIATGVAPFVVASTTQVSNLNASFLQGGTWASPGWIGQTTQGIGSFSSLVVNTSAVIDGELQATGRLSVMGAFAIASTAINVQPTILAGAFQFGMFMNMTATASATTAAYGYIAIMSTIAAPFTLPVAVGFVAENGNVGAGSTYTQQEGFRALDLTAAATNIGFRSMLSSGANKWNAYFDGTAKNYFAGMTGFGLLNPTYPIDVLSENGTAVGIRILGRALDGTGILTFFNNLGTLEQGRFQVDTGGIISFVTGSAPTIQVRILNTAGATAWLTLTGSVAGAPILSSSARGLAVNVTGVTHVTFGSQAGANTQFRIRGDNTSINWIDVFGTSTGNGPRAVATGADANIAFNLESKGTANIILTAPALTGSADNATDLGSTTRRFKDLYIQGRIAVGTGAFIKENIFIDSGLSGAVIVHSIRNKVLIKTDVTTSSVMFSSEASTQAGAFNLGELIHFNSAEGTIGAGSSITNEYGFKADASIGTATNNFGFHSGLFANPNSWAFYAIQNGAPSFFGARTFFDESLVEKKSIITYSASMTPNAKLGNVFVATATNATAFTINAPTNPSSGQRITITIRNTSGGALGAATWNAVFKMVAWTNPANGFSRSVDFYYDGTNWIENSRAAADVAN